MELLLQRDTLTGNSTGGVLYLNGEKFCYTLEDKMRENGRPVGEWKIKGQTAIPVGRYKVTIAPSPKRGGRLMPLLLAVPGFSGIQIHTGNHKDDTEGCILLGTKREPDTVRESTIAFDKFFPLLQHAVTHGEPVWMEIRNPDIQQPFPVEGVDA